MDEIQRKLSLIDRQLVGSDFHKQIISTCPLIFIAAGLISGIIIQSKIDPPGSIWSILLIICVLSTLWVFIAYKSSTRYVTAYLTLVCFVSLGAIRLISFNHPEPNDIRNLTGTDRTLTSIRGMVVTRPYINTNQHWKFANFRPADPTCSFQLGLAELKSAGGWIKAAGTIRVQVDEPVYDLEAGDNIQAYCWLNRFGPPSNPGQFDTAQYLSRHNIYIGASIKTRNSITLLPKSPAGIFTRLKTRIRELAAEALSGDLSNEDASRGLLQALLLGYRKNIDSDINRAFQKTGLLHFISLSGLHMGILTGMIWWLCKTIGLLKPARAVICIISVAVFLLIVPPRAPTLRAAIICWVFCASFLFRRFPNSINTLSLAAIILLLIRPTQLFEAGWQLSFATVLGIILLTKPIETFISEKIPNSRFHSSFSSKFISPVLKLFAVGFSAWLGGAGILLYHFHTITPLASVWTILVFPLVALILVLGFSKMVSFFILPTLSSLLAAPATLFSNLLIRIVKAIADLNISEILIGHVSIFPVIFYYSAIVFAVWGFSYRPRTRKIFASATLIITIFFLGGVKWQRTHRENLTLTCLDVGQGQAILVQLPGSTNILFDAGSLLRSDVGSRVVIPYLNYIGINTIEQIIISHNDIDHINGIPEIVEQCKVSGVYANDAFFENKDSWGTAEFLRNCLLEYGYEIKRLDKIPYSADFVKIDILWPTEQQYDRDLSDNDKSLVVSISFAGREILLCSDIEQFTQKELLRRYPELKVDIVIVPHHGSINTLDKSFLENLDADILICSCNRRQYESAKKTLTSFRADSFYTYNNGAVTVQINKDGKITTKTFMK